MDQNVAFCSTPSSPPRRREDDGQHDHREDDQFRRHGHSPPGHMEATWMATHARESTEGDAWVAIFSC